MFRNLIPLKPALAVSVLAITTFSALSADVYAADKKRGMLIIDASASMSGSLAGGKAAKSAPAGLETEGAGIIPRLVKRPGKASGKLSQVKSSLGRAYGDFRSRVNLGIVAFGSSAPESCTDIKAIKPVGSIDTKAYRAATNAISAVGASPITAAVKKAAELANYKNSINTMVLITDSIDSCSMNPCKLGGELRNSGANITVHVIGIGLPRNQQTNLRCLAGHTRGHYFDVRTRQQLTQAIYGAMNGISITRHLTPEPPPTPEVIAAAEKSAGAVIGSEKFTSVPLPRRKPRKPKTAEPKPEQPNPVKTAEAAKTIPAPPIPAEDVKAPQSKPPVIDNAKPVIAAAKPAADAKPAPDETSGRLTAQARIMDGTAPMTSGVSWTVYQAEAGAPSQRVATSKQAQPSFDLKPGDYVIESNLGYARVRDFVTIQSGEKASSDLVFNAGGLSLSTVLAGKPPTKATDVSYTVTERSTGRIVVRNLRSNKVIHLNSGDYEVISRYGSANAIVKANLSIQAGKLTEATLNHNAGRVKFKLASNDSGKALDDVSWEIQMSNGSSVASSAVSQPGYVLAAGAYKVIAKHAGNVYRSSFIVRPGEDKTKMLTAK